ncbi:threonine-phosphate decarboxylase CobD [Haloparvum alkalitolerans]|uniref:aminotransferase class I/II-fold pyridoxal phosphate-dependent enzyme n=1 Tax=Haloparvum alkalitolerans TaxID=1042953 RepID=UPI003CF575E3
MDIDALDTLGRVPHGGVNDPHVLDFSANTNPESPRGTAPVYDAAFSASRRYPADDYWEFRGAAADYVGCEGPQVIPAAGALDGMRLLFSVMLSPGDSVLLPRPSFSEYAHEVRLQGATPRFVDHDAVLDADPSDHAVAVVCNPNNPTGEAHSTGRLQAFAQRCREANTTLLLDEAFLDFTDRASLAGEPGVVVARSLTKVFGLPGLRAGFLVATGDCRDRLETARVSWGLSVPAAAVAVHCLDDEAFVLETRERVERERERMRERLESRFSVFPSDAPFLLFDVGDDRVDDVLDEAREAGIALRDARSFRTLDNHVRTAVRRPAENDRLLDALGV